MLKPNSQPTDQMDLKEAVIGLQENLLKVVQQSERMSDIVYALGNLIQRMLDQQVQDKAIAKIALQKAGFSKDEINEIKTQVKKEYTNIATRIDLDLLFNK